MTQNLLNGYYTAATNQLSAGVNTAIDFAQQGVVNLANAIGTTAEHYGVTPSQLADMAMAQSQMAVEYVATQASEMAVAGLTLVQEQGAALGNAVVSSAKGGLEYVATQASEMAAAGLTQVQEQGVALGNAVVSSAKGGLEYVQQEVVNLGSNIVKKAEYYEVTPRQLADKAMVLAPLVLPQIAASGTSLAVAAYTAVQEQAPVIGNALLTNTVNGLGHVQQAASDLAWVIGVEAVHYEVTPSQLINEPMTQGDLVVPHLSEDASTMVAAVQTGAPVPVAVAADPALAQQAEDTSQDDLELDLAALPAADANMEEVLHDLTNDNDLVFDLDLDLDLDDCVLVPNDVPEDTVECAPSYMSSCLTGMMGWFTLCSVTT